MALILILMFTNLQNCGKIMAQLIGPDEIESLRRSSFRLNSSSLRSNSSFNSSKDVLDKDFIQKWAIIERMPTFERSKACLFEEHNQENAQGKQITDVRQLGALDRHLFVERLIAQIEADNLRLLTKIRDRIDKQVRYKNLCVEAKCKVVDGKPLPTLWNSFKGVLSGITKLLGSKPQDATIRIIQNASGVIKPGKSANSIAWTARMWEDLSSVGTFRKHKQIPQALRFPKIWVKQVSGDVTYNGHKLDEFIPQKNSAYVSQFDLHIPEITVRETLDFSAHCQGIGSREEIMIELCRREKQQGIVPDPDIDAYMKATSAEGLKSTLQTDYILKILGLDICADTIIGDDMRRGISGGQKKRLTTGEMIVGPTKALLMDEITNGLDSSTAFQILSCIQQLVHITDTSALIALLQPAPEAFDLFDDIILMAEGKIVYHGPRSSVLEFFEECGFKCPQRKGVADFLQEVISRKDQKQYWFVDDQPYNYFTVDMFSEKFNASTIGKARSDEISQPYEKSHNDENTISFGAYSLSMWELFKVCASREYLLMKRNSFLYIFKTIQLIIVASITMTVFLRTRLRVDAVDANYYLGALFFGLIMLLVDGFPEAAFTIMRLPTFFKQRDLYFYPAWACTIPATILKIPLSLVESLVWTSLTYYVIGFSPEVGRFFRQFLLMALVHFSSMSLFRLLAAFFQNMVAAAAASSFFILFVFIFSGFIIPLPSMPKWLKWGFWIAPLSYGEIGLSVNEFLAPRWQKMTQSNTTIGQQVLELRGLDFAGYYYWISIGALIGFSILANIGYTLALTYLKGKKKYLYKKQIQLYKLLSFLLSELRPAPGTPDALISRQKLAQLQDVNIHSLVYDKNNTTIGDNKGRMALPFRPLTVSFQNVNYYVDTPMEMKEHGFSDNKLQILSDVTGAFRPGVLTALMGVTGAGKTTLLDVLAGRKTSGYIEDDIRISGFPKVQETFARVSGYCEQTDIHSSQITVEESLIFSAWLRLPNNIGSETRNDFVSEVLETIELDEIKDALVGIPGVNGLSTEQRKRLTIAVELVSNPSVIFMDEPTTGLDARAAAIVMRAVKNVTETGRTVVCTIHQPSIDIFEAFDELILLKTGGQIIYSGPLGQHSQNIIQYFQSIPGVPKIRDNYNPSTWMLDVTSTSAEHLLEVDFAQIYHNSVLHNSLDQLVKINTCKGFITVSMPLIIRNTEELVKQLSTPPSSSEDLHFPTRFSQNGLEQFKSCLWKLHLSYWRSPQYNSTRLLQTLVSSLIFGLLFWQQGRNIKNQQSLFTVFGSMFAGVIFLGINNCSNVLPHVAMERTVVYRERFAGMYSSWAYSFAQVTIEIPYLLTEAILFTIITYPMIGYHVSAYKIFWYCYAMFCTLMYFNFLGMMLVSLTPNFQAASIIASTFYSMFNLFAGFLITKPRIPGWWIWLYYLCPTSWTLFGMLSSQYGDVETRIDVFGQSKTVSGFLNDYFGFDRDQLGLVAAVLIAFPLGFASLFAIFMGKLNFQRRILTSFTTQRKLSMYTERTTMKLHGAASDAKSSLEQALFWFSALSPHS
ncbi:LOW QUALITY PROTEIN: hypothetical protein V2J09_019711 [Rumex salicifolius]